MSGPDKIAELRARAKAAEEQTLSAYLRLSETPRDEILAKKDLYFDRFVNEVQAAAALIRAYKEYIEELEKYVPR